MFGKLFRPRKQSRPERPSFKPVLESLEKRDVPSAADVNAAFNALPGDIHNLETNLMARDINGVESSLVAVSGDLFQLKLGASGFVLGDRLQIDATLFADGVRLAIDGVYNFSNVPTPLAVDIIQLGFDASAQGVKDILAADFFPMSSGDSVLT